MYRSRLAFALAMAALAAILLPSPLPAQITFQRTYGGAESDEGYSIQQNSDGGYVVTGSTASLGTGYCDSYLVKANAAGDKSPVSSAPLAQTGRTSTWSRPVPRVTRNGPGPLAEPAWTWAIRCSRLPMAATCLPEKRGRLVRDRVTSM